MFPLSTVLFHPGRSCLLGVPREFKEYSLFPNLLGLITVALYSYYRSNQKKKVSPRYGAIIPRLVWPSPLEVNGNSTTYQLRQLRRYAGFTVQTFVRAAAKSCRKYKP